MNPIDTIGKREIKFRAWNKEMKYMSPVGQLNEMKSVLIYVPEQTDEDGNVYWDGDVVGMEKVELMQYTGLKDKNGKDIYEGDILVRHKKSGTYKTKRVVAFGYNEQIFAEESEVIGNVFETPELIK
jgi:ribosomal protein L27